MKIKNPLEVIDDAIMYSAEKAIQGFNYITGKDKKNLANIFAGLGLTIETLNSISKNDFIFPALMFGITFLQIRLNEDMANMEKKLKNSGLKINPEERKYRKFLGYYLLTYATCLGHEDLTKSSNYSLPAYAISNFIIAVDTDTPYKKNILSRVVDSLKEKQMNPATSFSRERLEDRLVA